MRLACAHVGSVAMVISQIIYLWYKSNCEYSENFPRPTVDLPTLCTNALRKVKTCICRVRDWLTFRNDTSSVKYCRREEVRVGGFML